MLQFFGFLSGLLPMLGTIPYIRDILRRKTKPHRGSFLIWAILGAIAFSSQLATGATWSLFLPAADVLATLTIFLLSIRYGVGGLSKSDIICLTAAAVGLLLWAITKQPLVALVLTVAIDAVGTIMTLIKTWADPGSETFSSWLLVALGGLCALVAVDSFSLALVLYPAYMFIGNGLVNVVMLIRRPKIATEQA